MAASAVVTDHDRYLFDIRGYLVLRGVLDGEQVALYNAILDRLGPETISDPDQRDETLRWLFDIDPKFAQLMDHEAVLPYLSEFVGGGLRIDGAYSLVKLPGEGVPLHAQPESPRDGTGWYHVHRGRITSGLTGVQWALTDMPPGTGGLCVVPGSHKANFEIALEELTGDAEDVAVSAGDVIVFTEALTHGSRWHGPGSRRVLIYKYCPATVAWGSDVKPGGRAGESKWNESSRAPLTDRQRLMTLPPYVFDAASGQYRHGID